MFKMLTEHNQGCFKEQRLSELNNTEQPNGTKEGNNSIHQIGDRKWTLPELISLMESQGLYRD